jgi:anti-anti-sigma factor
MTPDEPELGGGNEPVSVRLGDVLDRINIDYELEITRTMDSQGGAIIVDVSNVTFVDTAGIGILAELLGRASAQKRPVVLHGASWELRRLLVIAGVEPLFRYQ